MAVQKTSAKGIAFIHSFEQRRLKAYRSFKDEPWTIGWGHTSNAGLPKVTQGMVITSAEADQIFVRDLAKFERRVRRYIKVKLSQGQFDALVSFDYNTGALDTASFVQLLNAGNYAAVPAGMAKYVNSGKQKNVKGLVRRRKGEIALWNDKMLPSTKKKIGVAVGTGTAVATGGGAVVDQVQSAPDTSIVDTALNTGTSLLGGYSTTLTVIGAVIVVAVLGFMVYKLIKKDD